jgi:hypothetical protein
MGWTMNVEQGAGKPAISVAREMRGQIFVWFGIVGGALTIVNHWSNFVTLADWMHWLVEHWTFMLNTVWNWLLSLLGIKFSKELASLLSLLVFYSGLTAGTVLLSDNKKNPIPDLKALGISFLFVPIFLVIILSLAIPLNYMADYFGIADANAVHFIRETTIVYKIFSFVTTVLIMSPFGAFFLILNNNEIGYRRWLAVASMGILITLNFRLILNAMLFMGQNYDQAIFVNQDYERAPDFSVASVHNLSSFALAMVLITLIVIGPLVFAPIRPLVKRINFILIGVAIIFGLSEVSKQVERLHEAAPQIEAPH